MNGIYPEPGIRLDDLLMVGQKVRFDDPHVRKLCLIATRGVQRCRYGDTFSGILGESGQKQPQAKATCQWGYA